MGKYRVKFFAPYPTMEHEEKVIECGRLEIRDNCYSFWTSVYGQSNRLIASYPIQYTIVEEIIENNHQGGTP